MRRRYEWVYLYGFVRPQDGEIFWLILPTVNAKAFSLALRQFAEWVDVGEDKRVLLVLDRAGRHTGGEVEVPKGVELEFLPARSPELQPAERLWPLVNERVANRLFEDLFIEAARLFERNPRLHLEWLRTEELTPSGFGGVGWWNGRWFGYRTTEG